MAFLVVVLSPILFAAILANDKMQTIRHNKKRKKTMAEEDDALIKFYISLVLVICMCIGACLLCMYWLRIEAVSRWNCMLPFERCTYDVCMSV